MKRHSTPAKGNPALPQFLSGYNPADPDYQERLRDDLGKIKEQIKAQFPLGTFQMNAVQEAFVRIKNRFGRMPKTRLMEAGNQTGKTFSGVAEDIAHAMGFRPWLEKDDPDYKIAIKVPNVGMMGCEVAGQTLSQRIEPLFMEFIPKFCLPEISRYSDGSLKSLKLTYDYEGKPCGSTIHFRSYVQPAESYEGLIFDWIHWDEPPPRAVLNAAERGKMSTNAPSWFTMTPLKEPYIYDIFSLKAFNNGGDDQEIAVFRGATWDNCADWCRACNITIEANQPENLAPGQMRPVRRCPGCRKVMGFMPRAGIENYLKKITDPDEREAREEGKWKHLSGCVYKELSRDLHLYPDFEIPSGWMRIEVVDPHDAKPTRWLFGAVSPEEIVIAGKTSNRIYFYTYLLLGGTLHEMVRRVKVHRAEKGYHHPELVILDAKYGARTVKTMEGETSWEEELEKAGIRNITLSHSAPGDVSLGHKAVKDYLRPQYSALRGKEIPGMLFAAQGCAGDRGPWQDMQNYSWDPKSPDKPAEAYKDFCDCYDAQTEVLTDFGWKYFNSLGGDERVATFNLKTGHLEFQKPTDYINSKYSGPMVEIKGRSIDLLITPNHKMICANAGGIEYPKHSWGFKSAENASLWDVIPVSSRGEMDCRTPTREDWEFEFMGWYIAEGCATGTRGGKIQTPGRGYSVYIAQTENSTAMPQLRELMARVPYHSWYNGHSFVISNKALWGNLFPLGNSHEKHLPDWVFEGSREQLLKLWDCYVMGDGWTHKGTDVAATVSPRLADDMQRLLSTAGFGSSIHTRVPSGSHMRGHDILKENCSLQYSVTRKTGNVAHLCTGDKKPIFSTVDYQGYIYCVTVPNHTLLVRRNSTPVFCGNCVRYAALEQLVYKRPEPEIDPVLAQMLLDKQHNQDKYEPMTYGLSLKIG